MAINAYNNIYISCGNSIRKINSSGIIDRVAGNGTATVSDPPSGDGGPATSASFYSYAIALTPSNELLISGNNRIRKVDLSGNISTIAGGGSGSADGVAATSISIAPTGTLACNSSGEIYFSDTRATMRKINTSGIISTIAGIAGIQDYSGDCGPATAAKMTYACGICIDANNKVYFFDKLNGRLRKIANGPVPDPGAITGTSSMCSGYNTLLSNTTADADGGGTWSSSNTAVATVSSTGTVYSVSAGSATISYTVTNSCGSNAATRSVTVNALPSISAGSSVSICTGTGTTLAATGGVTYSWLPGTGLSATTGSGPAANPAATTTYTATGTNANGCVNTGTVTVTVNALPTIGAGSSVSICSGTGTTLTATGGVTYTWSPGTGLSATTGASPVAHPAVTTTYTVTGANANGCTGTGTLTVTVNPLPYAGIITGRTTTVCRGMNDTLTTNGDAGGLWMTPAISPSSNTAATVNPTTGIVTAIFPTASNLPHMVQIKYIVTNGCGADTANFIVRALGQPSIAATPSSMPNICVGETFTVTGSPHTSSPAQLIWDTLLNVPVTPIYSYSASFIANSGPSRITFRYLYTDNDYCSTLIPSQSDSIIARPVISLSAPLTLSVAVSGTCAPHSGTVTLTTSPGGSAYQWSASATASLACGTCLSSTNTVTAVSNGMATITLSELGFRCTRRDTVTFNLSMVACKPAPDEISDNTDDYIRVYPNPNTGTFTLEIPTGFDAAAITITNINGKVIEAKITDKPKQDFDLSQYPRGIYIIAVDAGDKKYREKVLLQ